MSMAGDAHFRDRISRKYARSAIADQEQRLSGLRVTFRSISRQTFPPEYGGLITGFAADLLRLRREGIFIAIRMSSFDIDRSGRRGP